MFKAIFMLVSFGPRMQFSHVCSRRRESKMKIPG
jgi:hypothetical protein